MMLQTRRKSARRCLLQRQLRYWESFYTTYLPSKTVATKTSASQTLGAV